MQFFPNYRITMTTHIAPSQKPWCVPEWYRLQFPEVVNPKISLYPSTEISLHSFFYLPFATSHILRFFYPNMWNPVVTGASVKENFPAPRDLQQSFQKATFGSEPSPEQLQQRIIQLELTLTSVTKHHMAQQQTIQRKDERLQNLQAILHRLESKNQDDQFQEIDEAGMRGSPDAYLHSQQWKSWVQPQNTYKRRSLKTLQ